MLGLCLNTINSAPSQYAGWNMNSMCSFNGKILCANANGIFEHSGTTDNASNISAYFRLASMNFGIPRQKRGRKLYIGGYVSGELMITVVTDEDDETVYYTGKVSADNVVIDVPLNFEDKGEFIGIQLANVDGADFSIDDMSLLFAPIVLQPKTSQEVGRVKQTIPSITVAASGS